MAQKKQDYHTTRENNQKEKNTPHSYSTLALPFPISHSLGRVAPPPPPYRPPLLSLLLASRVVGPVVEQGVHGVFLFFFYLERGKTMVFMAGFSGWGIRSETLYAWYPGRTDGLGQDEDEREREGGVSTRTRVYLTMQAHGYRLFFLPTVSSLLAAWLDLY